MEDIILSTEQNFTIHAHRYNLTEATRNVIASAKVEGRPVTVTDFEPMINLTLQVLELAIKKETFAKEALKEGWGL